MDAPEVPVRVGLVVADARMRGALRAVVGSCRDLRVELEADTTTEALELVRAMPVDVVVVDMPSVVLLDAVRGIRLVSEPVRILALGMHEGLACFALAAGADEYLVKGSAPVVAFIRELAAEVPVRAAVSRQGG